MPENASLLRHEPSGVALASSGRPPYAWIQRLPPFRGPPGAQGALEQRVIRKYQPEDSKEVLGVWASASTMAHPFLSREFMALERHNIPNVYLPKADTWVWEVDGQVVAFMSLLGNEVGALFVDPEAQRAGIGQALIDRARALRGELHVEVFKDNRLGRAFYAKCGFEVTRRGMHVETGCEVLRLRLPAAEESGGT